VLVVEVYRVTDAFPPIERFALTAQLRRAAVSIPSNIAEGHARFTPGEYKNSLSVARGSVAEVEAQLIVAQRLGYTDGPAVAAAFEYCDAISRMITNLRRAL
jgi:four helix bundle protein